MSFRMKPLAPGRSAPNAYSSRPKVVRIYRALAEQVDRPLRIAQSEQLAVLEAKAANLAAAVRRYLVHDAG